MGADFEMDVCPKCGSVQVDTTYDAFQIVRLSLRCRNCHYLEIINEHPQDNCECEPETPNPWETDPDAWKQ